MTILDLVFLLAALLSIVSLLTAAGLAIAGRRAPALRLAGILGVFVLGYLAIDATVAFLEPQQVLAVDKPWCFDDWCLAVEGVTRQSAGTQALYTVDLRLFSRAGRISQRARGAWIYLVDAQGRRYPPTAAPDEVPLDVLLGPLESRRTSRTFAMPGQVQPVGLVTGHGGGYCGVMSLVVIGQGGCLFGKPTMVGLSGAASPPPDPPAGR